MRSGQSNMDSARYAEAETDYAAALALCGPGRAGSERYMETLGGLAEACRLQGKLTESDAAYCRLIANYERSPARQPMRLADLYCRLADLDVGQAEFGEAEQMYKRGLAIYAGVEGAGGRHVAEALAKLARVYAREGVPARAAATYARAFRIKQQLLAPQSPELLESMLEYSELLRSAHRTQDADRLKAQALGGRDRT